MNVNAVLPVKTLGVIRHTEAMRSVCISKTGKTGQTFTQTMTPALLTRKDCVKGWMRRMNAAGVSSLVPQRR